MPGYSKNPDVISSQYIENIYTASLNYCVGATATILYWFGMKTGQLEPLENPNPICACQFSNFCPESSLSSIFEVNDPIRDKFFINHDVSINVNGIFNLKANKTVSICNNSVFTNNSDLNIGEDNGNSNSNLLIETGSKIVLRNSTSKTYVYPGAELRVKSGSTLIIGSGAKIEIKDGGRFIIEPGATLLYEPGAHIILNGDNAILDIGGKLILQDNATFTFTGSGHIVWRTPWMGSPQIEAGVNSKIHLEGSGQQDLVLKVEVGGLFWTPELIEIKSC